MDEKNQRQNKFKGKLSEERGKKLDSIRFMWDKYEHEWHVFCAVKRFKDKEEVAEREEGRGQARGGVGRWQTNAEGLGIVDGHSKDRQKQWQIGSTPRRDVERDLLCVG